MKYLTVFLTMISLVSYADYETQTDWSAGPGVINPVNSWENSFYGSNAVDWSGNSGSLQLSENVIADPVMHCVAESYLGRYSICPADIDGDGDNDIVCGSEPHYRIDWWVNSDTQPGLFISQNTIDSLVHSPRSLSCIDLDVDGDVDLLGADFYSVLWWANNGSDSAWTRHIVKLGSHLAGVHAADIDGDGDLDVSAMDPYQSGGSFYWIENTDGIGTSWVSHTVADSFYFAHQTFLHDLDGDGDVDMLAGGGDGVCWYENIDGLGTHPWNQHVVDPGVGFAESITAFDFDGDGDTDISGADGFQYDIAWWENVDGLGDDFLRHDITLQYVLPDGVCPCDFDSDGDYDFLSVTYGDNEVTIWENLDGAGDIWQEITIESDFMHPSAASTADLDNDGNQDALGVGDDIHWWDVCGIPSEGYLVSSILHLGVDPGWEDISWNHTSPEGTSIAFLVRSSDDPGSMGAWSDTLFYPGSLYGILDDGDSYMQYQALLQTDSLGTTPVLDDVTASWNATGIEGHPQSSNRLIGAECNPSFGTVSIEFELFESKLVELIIFDISGRMVHQVCDGYSSGRNEVELTDLRTGIYFVRMTSRDFQGTERFVVLE